jgi:hypothetical protein
MDEFDDMVQWVEERIPEHCKAVIEVREKKVSGCSFGVLRFSNVCQWSRGHSSNASPSLIARLCVLYEYYA